MLNIQDIKAEAFFLMFLCAVIFYQIQKAELKTVVSMLLITVWGAAVWYYLQDKSKKAADTSDAILDKVNTENLKHPEIISTNFAIKSAPKKGLVYLKENNVLTGIIKDIGFLKTFDLQKYQELLVYMNQYQKTYMYILAERYPCQSYVPTFLDTRENILELLYQCYLVVPAQFKHIYGFDPYKVLEKNIQTFHKLSRTMIEVLENFCRMDLKEHYFPMSQPAPLDLARQKEKQNILP